MCRRRGLIVTSVMLSSALATGTAGASWLTTSESAAPPAALGSTQPQASRPQLPGPDLLYRPLARAPQFENTGVWKAEPILTSGAMAYRKGEFLYQDFIYDDHGANSSPAPDLGVVPIAGSVSVSSVGDYTYPTDPQYANNAADLLEVRVALLPRATAFRLAFNTMLRPDLVATTLALGGTAGVTHPMPHGANASMPASIFATVHGGQVELINATTGSRISSSDVSATVDLERRQIQVIVPFGVWDPRGSRVRLAAATGLWHSAAGRFLAPQFSADAGHPGGSGQLQAPPAFFNVAFRYSESGHWNERMQANALEAGDLSGHFASVDFTKIKARVIDELRNQPGGAPTTGFVSRIHASHFEPSQGVSPAPPACVQPCDDLVPELSGNLQPYTMYIPTKTPPARGYGLTIDIHGASGNYRRDAMADTPGITRLGPLLAERGTGSLVVWPGGRGGTLWWWGISAAEIFEVWADLKTRFPIDPTYVEVVGASMGGSGTLRTISLWPDLFARIGAQIPCTSADTAWLGPEFGSPQSGEATVLQHLAPSLRNVPMFVQAAAQDVICVLTAQNAYRDTMDALGYRYEWRQYPGEHISGAVAVSLADPHGLPDFLGDARLGGDPHHVTYVMNHKANQTKFGLNADHAYWVSGLAVRNQAGAAPLGQVDVLSHGFGVADAPALPTEPIAGPANGWVGQQKQWGPTLPSPVSNGLDIVVQNISTLTIDVRRARVGCDVTLNVKTEGPVVIRLLGCERTETYAAPAAGISSR